MLHIILDYLTLFFYRITSGRLRKKVSTEQFEHNKEKWNEITSGKNNIIHNGYIERQYLLGDISYGKDGKLSRKLFYKGKPMTAADNSCEVIAVYNAVNALIRNEKPSFPGLLNAFSNRGISFGGVFGTSPYVLKRYFKKEGFTVKSLGPAGIRKDKINALEKDYDTFIFTTYNVRFNPSRMIHTMCITKERNGLMIHNDYEGSKTYKDLYSAVTGYRDGAGHPFYVIGIR